MPQYYHWQRQATTNGTPNTCSSHLRLITIANQQNCGVAQLMANVRNSTTAGSGTLMVGRLTGGAGAGGQSQTPKPMNTGFAAAQTTAFDDAAAFTGSGTGVVYYQSVGFAQTGGQGGWVPIERDNCITLAPNGGANGNLTLDSFTATASQALQVGIQFLEG